ncbi:M20 family metallopeptidase [Hyphococcus lacteus]|uniref:M20/M25/M40 family metallo-hydrolase n=1 Tax=Hyphococcus lacteus TaxID=3143536 RepID=A0ABV3Z7W1_9PROT
MFSEYQKCQLKRAAALSLGMLTAALSFTAQPASATDSFSDKAVAAIERDVAGFENEATTMLVEVGSIMSPSGEEDERAAKVADKMREIGLNNVKVTEDLNVIGRIPGRSGKAIIFVSTLDDLKTVAEHQRERNAPLNIAGGRVEGPGSNTSSTTVAIIAAARSLLKANFKPKHDVIFAAVSQEETGLNGMRALYDTYKDDAILFVDVLGDGRSISYGALGIHWWKVVAEGPPGHTLRGGLPNINQGIARAVDQIFDLPQPRKYEDRMTRVNVAILNSGKVFNHKPPKGWFSLDIRSLDAPMIEEIESDVRKILRDVAAETSVSLTMVPENMTPGGQIPGALESDLVRWSVAISKRLGLEPALNDAGSANLNIAIANGTPAIGLGGERGGQRGHPDEWADIDAMMRTARHVALLGYFLGQDVPAPAD